MNSKMTRRAAITAALTFVATSSVISLAAGRQKSKPIKVTMPLEATLAVMSPKDAVPLFAGKTENLKENWYKRNSTDPAGWTVDEKGAFSPTDKNDITSKREFGDCYVHAEWRCITDADGKVMGHGNSGVALEGRYEIQAFNSFGENPSSSNAGALYSQKAAIVNAGKKGGEWETFDIVFRAPRFDADKKVTEKARATVYQNGVLVQDNQEFNGPTGIQYGDFKGEVPKGPIVLQGNHDPVQFRNVWVLPLDK